MLRDSRDQMQRAVAVPTADEVPFCPPHWWVIDEDWQRCRKCGEERPVHQVEAMLEPEVERGAEMGELGEGTYVAE